MARRGLFDECKFTDLARNHHIRPMLWGLLLLQGTAMSMNLGKDGVSKTDEFSEKFQKGGGSFSIQKFILQILDL